MSYITLIRPPMVVVRAVPSRSCVPPLGLAYLAACLQKEDHIVDAIDSVGESIFQIYPVHEGKYFAHGLTLDEVLERLNPKTDYFGISCMFSHEWPIARDLIKKIRKNFPDRPIVVGGEHVTATAQITLEENPEIDYCIIGEGEFSFLSLISLLDNGKPVPETGAILSQKNPVRHIPTQGSVDRNLRALRIQKVDDIPPPSWDLFPLSAYLDNGFGHGVQGRRSLPFLATRGCPFQCTFCSSPQMWTTTYLTRDPRKILDEMEHYNKLYGVQNFGFCDLTMVTKRSWIIEYCKSILERKLDITYQFPNGTRSEAIDEEVADLLYRTGCRTIYYAPESGSPRVLKRIKKAVDLKKMKRSMRSSLRSGIVVKANIIIGFPEEKHSEIWETIWFIWELAVIGVQDITITGFIPYPGSELFHQLRTSGRIPEYNDEYLWSLASTSTVKKTVSWSLHISSRALHRYKFFGLISFYIVSYSLRPWRFFKALYNIIMGRPDETRIESVLRTAYRMIFRRRQLPEISPVTKPPTVAYTNTSHN